MLLLVIHSQNCQLTKSLRVGIAIHSIEQIVHLFIGEFAEVVDLIDTGPGEQFPVRS